MNSSIFALPLLFSVTIAFLWLFLGIKSEWEDYSIRTREYKNALVRWHILNLHNERVNEKLCNELPPMISHDYAFIGRKIWYPALYEQECLKKAKTEYSNMIFENQGSTYDMTEAKAK